MYLVPSLVKHAHLTWDYRDIDGCEKVLLQIAGERGFGMPNAEDARADPGVRTWYEGPNFIDYHDCGEHLGLLGLEGDPPSYSADDLDLQVTKHISFVQDFLYLRLVPLDSSGNQLPLPASDHVEIHCCEYPAIVLETCEIEWIWGEELRRLFHFTIQLQERFPSTLICGSVSAPSTLIISSHHPNWGFESAVQDISLVTEDDLPPPRLGVWRDHESYFQEIPEWESCTQYSFTLEQVFPSRGSKFQIFREFLEPKLEIECIPGLTPGLLICTKTMLEGDQPVMGSLPAESSCARPLLSATWNDPDSGLAQLYDLFTQPLSGRRIHPRDGEQDVSVRFEFSEPVDSVDDLRNMIALSTMRSTITMVERIGDTEKNYHFWCEGIGVSLRTGDEFIGGRHPYSAYLVFDPPNLEMHFWLMSRDFPAGPLEYYLSLD